MLRRLDCRSVSRLQDPVQRRRRPHHRIGLRALRIVVAADIGGLALHRLQLAQDLLLVLGQRLRERRESLRELGVVGLRGQRLRPVQREVEVAAAIVELACARARRLVVFEELARRFVERLREDLRPLVARLDGDRPKDESDSV